MVIQLCIMLHVKKSAFLRNRIKQIKTAILHCPDDEFFNLQAVSTNVLKLDDNNYLWLSVDKPVSCEGEATTSFDIVLNYNHKEGNFDLDILGEARLLTDEEEIKSLPAVIAREVKKGKLILHVHILDLDFWEQKPPVLTSIAKKIKYMFATPGVSNSEDQQVYSDRQMSA